MEKNKRVICIIQARLGSSRFKNKIFKKVLGQRLIHILYKRISESKIINKVIVAIPYNNENNLLFQYLKRKNIPVFRGSENNVLNRFYHAAKFYKGDVIVRVTSDCPLLSSDIIDEHLKVYFRKKNKIITNYLSRTFPIGISLSILDFKTLKFANKFAKNKYDKEHVMPFLYKNMKLNILKTFNNSDLHRLRLTLDYPNDLKTIKNVFNYFNPNIYFSWKEIVKLYKSKPKLFKENQQINF